MKVSGCSKWIGVALYAPEIARGHFDWILSSFATIANGFAPENQMRVAEDMLGLKIAV